MKYLIKILDNYLTINHTKMSLYKELNQRRKTIDDNISILTTLKGSEKENMKVILSKLVTNHIDFLETKKRHSQKLMELFIGKDGNPVVFEKLKKEYDMDKKNLVEDFEKYKEFIQEPLKLSLNADPEKNENKKELEEYMEFIFKNWDSLQKGDWIMLNSTKKDTNKSKQKKINVDETVYKPTYDQELLTKEGNRFIFEVMNEKIKQNVQTLEKIIDVLKIEVEVSDKVEIANQVFQFTESTTFEMVDKNDHVLTVAGGLLKYLQSTNLVPTMVHKCAEFSWNTGEYMFCVLDELLLKYKGKGKKNTTVIKNRFSEILRLQGYKPILKKKPTIRKGVVKTKKQEDKTELFKLGRENSIKRGGPSKTKFQQPKTLKLQSIQGDPTKRIRTSIKPIVVATAKKDELSSMLERMSLGTKPAVLEAAKPVKVTKQAREKQNEKKRRMAAKEKEKMMKRREKSLFKAKKVAYDKKVPREVDTLEEPRFTEFQKRMLARMGDRGLKIVTKTEPKGESMMSSQSSLSDVSMKSLPSASASSRSSMNSPSSRSSRTSMSSMETSPSMSSISLPSEEGLFLSPKPSPKNKKGTPPGKILNPKTGRYVSVSGVMGKKLLKEQKN